MVSLGNNAGSLLSQSGYDYDSGGRRTNAVIGPAEQWEAELDALGQLRSAGLRENGLSYPHQQTSWSYDGAQNVASRTKGGLTYNFNTDSLNRLTSLTRSGTATVVGFATNNLAAVSVNGVAGTVYTNNTFAVAGVPLSGETNTFTAIAQDTYYRKATNTATAVFPQTVSISYDANGNMTNDGKRTLEYDAENRLTNVFIAAQWRSSFVYDGLSRRRIRREYTWTNSAWRLTNEVRYLYEGLLVLQERNSNNVPRLTYTRGWDLSGTPQGAGGIGGLYAMTVHGIPITSYTNYYYHSDGNGNITAIIDTNQNLVASAAYQPFGEFYSLSGTLTNLNRYWFSSKEWDAKAEMYLYSFRNYKPKLQRWTTEDPIGIAGGINAFGFVYNNPYEWVDPDGLAPLRPGPRGSSQSQGEITREILEGLRHGGSGRRLSSTEQFYENARRAARDAHLARRFPGHTPGQTHLTSGPTPPGAPPSVLECPPTSGSQRNSVAPDEILSRLGQSYESAARLGRKAAEAEAQIGIHGVSVSASPPLGPASQASRSSVEARFPVHDTPTRNDPLHRTVELPKPVTPEVARDFNTIFGRE